MPLYIVEHTFPEAEGLPVDVLNKMIDASDKACKQCQKEIDKDMMWLNSFIIKDRIICIYNAPNEEAIMRHNELAGFTVNKITPIVYLVDPVRKSDRKKRKSLFKTYSREDIDISHVIGDVSGGHIEAKLSRLSS